jgi:hypothetical protein
MITKPFRRVVIAGQASARTPQRQGRCPDGALHGNARRSPCVRAADTDRAETY